MNVNGKNGNNVEELSSENRERRLMIRGVRGATTVTSNDKDEILEATRELLTMIVRVNEIDLDDVASMILTTTHDLDATYPAFAARQLGWFDVALLCGHEMNVPDGLPLCIRVLVHWNTTKSPKDIGHIYLRDAKSLRPDRHNIPPIRPVQMNNMDAAMKVLAQGL
ncbi:MAG: chorismate mutase [Candidatus Promineifilaceae bacterium]|nr:chorismate mutase [Candidatus Promineifilaceae bacterium]